MNTHQRTSRCRIISIASARPATVSSTVALLALIRGQRTMNLTELAHTIAADPNLTYRITEAACQEFGWRWLSVEHAIVLLGRQRLATLLTIPMRHGRSASRLNLILHVNHSAPAANLIPLENRQEESK